MMKLMAEVEDGATAIILAPKSVAKDEGDGVWTLGSNKKIEGDGGGHLC